MRFSDLSRGIRPLLGTVVGVGIFGLPYAFAHVGFGLGLLSLILVAILSLLALLLYADLILLRKGHGRYLTVVGHDLSPFERAIATLAYFGSHFGALLAYVIVGGSFAHAVFTPLIGGSLLLYQLAFWAMGSLVVAGGLSFLVRVQGFLFPLLFLLILVHAFLLIPRLSTEHFGGFHPENAVLSLGVLIFAFGGLSAVPDMRDILRRNRGALRASLVLGMMIIALLYAVFAFLVVGVTGEGTTPQGLDGIANALGPAAAMIGSLLGLGLVMSAYLAVSVGMVNALVYDWRQRYLPAWGLVVVIPMALVLLGATNFITVIGVTGGALGSLLGMFLVIAYERARASHALPKHALSMPSWAVAISFFLYAGTFLLTLHSALAALLL